MHCMICEETHIEVTLWHEHLQAQQPSQVNKSKNTKKDSRKTKKLQNDGQSKSQERLEKQQTIETLTTNALIITNSSHRSLTIVRCRPYERTSSQRQTSIHCLRICAAARFQHVRHAQVRTYFPHGAFQRHGEAACATLTLAPHFIPAAPRNVLRPDAKHMQIPGRGSTS